MANVKRARRNAAEHSERYENGQAPADSLADIPTLGIREGERSLHVDAEVVSRELPHTTSLKAADPIQDATLPGRPFASHARHAISLRDVLGAPLARDRASEAQDVAMKAVWSPMWDGEWSEVQWRWLRILGSYESA